MRQKPRKSFVGLAILLSSLFCVATARSQDAATLESIHNALRAVKDRAIEAFNKRDKDALLKEFSTDVAFTAMNNEVVHGIDGLSTYYDKMLASPSRFIDEVTGAIEADELSHLYAGGQVAVATGKADAHFKMVGGKEFDWPLRWTATLTRDGDKWSIAAFHISGDAIDNPIVSAAKFLSFWMSAAFGLIGLVVGLVTARLIRLGGRPRAA